MLAYYLLDPFLRYFSGVDHGFSHVVGLQTDVVHRGILRTLDVLLIDWYLGLLLEDHAVLSFVLCAIKRLRYRGGLWPPRKHAKDPAPILVRFIEGDRILHAGFIRFLNFI